MYAKKNCPNSYQYKSESDSILERINITLICVATVYKNQADLFCVICQICISCLVSSCKRLTKSPHQKISGGFIPQWFHLHCINRSRGINSVIPACRTLFLEKILEHAPSAVRWLTPMSFYFYHFCWNFMSRFSYIRLGFQNWECPRLLQGWHFTHGGRKKNTHTH